MILSAMKPETTLVRDPGDRSLSSSVFLKEESARGGQRARYRVRLRSKGDVEEARRTHLPMPLLEPETV